MQQVVIIGAGPAGLYAAIKLRKAHVIDLVVYDPRAGEYTRPGHLNSEVFYRAKIGLPADVKPSIGSSHIKDFERQLYREAAQLNIRIERKKFVGLVKEKNAVIVEDENGIQSTVACYYLLDCTGSKREVLHAVNNLVTNPPPFQITPVLKDHINVKNHFLAYVKMSAEDYLRFAMKDRRPDRLSGKTMLDYARSIEHLRSLGWLEFGYPSLYGVSFNKSKVCIYLECPDNLPVEMQESWLKAVLEYKTNTKSISFQQLPASKKYRYKPRWNSFIVEPHETSRYIYQEKGLPTIIPLGDSVIDANYVIAHGVKDSMEIINNLIEEMTIIDGKIYFFDDDMYLRSIKEQIELHRNDLVRHYDEAKGYFGKWLNDAKGYYELATDMSINIDEQRAFQERLKEISIRINYQKAIETLARENSQTGANVSPNFLRVANETHQSFLQVIENLPEHFVHEHATAKSNLLAMAQNCKDLGNSLFQEEQYSSALQAYNLALTIYQSLHLQTTTSLAEVTLLSNLIIVHRKLGDHNEISQLVRLALEYDSSQASIKEKQQKILYNLIKAVIAILKDNDNMDSALKFAKDAYRIHHNSQYLLTERQKSLLQADHKEIVRILKASSPLAQNSVFEFDETQSGGELRNQNDFNLELNCC